MKLLQIKSFRQSPGMCGPACLKMVLEYYGIKMTEKKLAKLCGATVSHGVEAEPMLAAAKKLGLKGFVKDHATISELRKFLKKEIPVIVDWFSINDGHYSVVIGVGREYIYLEDPELGKLNKIKIDIFHRVWFDFPGKYLRTPKDLLIRRALVLHR